MTFVAAALGTAAAIGMMGCSQGKDKGAASVNVNALSIGDVASLKVIVQSPTVLNSGLTVSLVKKGNQYSALVGDLTIASDYTFTASAKDASNNELYHGSAPGTIAKNQTANIVINMNQVAAGQPLSNSAPVIDSITASSLLVSNDDTVSINATAHDPDPNETAAMGFAWTSTCAGSLSNVVTVAGSDSPAKDGTSAVTFTAPAATFSGPCSVTVTVTDAHGLLKNVASLVIQVNPASAQGSAKITALPNTYPVISDLKATPVPLVKGTATTLTVDATDADGDTLNYHWSSTNCASGTFGTATAASTTFTLDSASSATSCTFSVVVDDGLFPDGSHKGIITNSLTLPVFSPVANVAAGAPVFGFSYQTEDMVSGGDVVTMEIVSTDGCAGGSIDLEWSDSDGHPLPPIATPDAPFTSGVTYTAIAGFESQPAPVTVTVTATCSLVNSVPATHTFNLIPANSVCAVQAEGSDCTSTARLSNKCVTAATCVSKVCTPTATGVVSCPTSAPGVDQCNANVCDKTSGLCVVGPVTDGTNCNDNNACTFGVDICSAGVCTYATGHLHVCDAPSNVCLQATCNPATNNCDVSDHDGVACNDHNGCTGQSTLPPSTGLLTPDTCSGGVCGGAAVTCTGTLVCTSQGDDTHTCDPKGCMTGNNYAKKWVPPFSGMGVSATGTPWAAGQIYNPFDFGSGSVTSSGSADIYLTKLDPATGLATQSFTFGDMGGKDQVASGVAVASSGNVGLIGYFTGEIDFTASNSDGSGPSGLPGTAGADFLQNSSAIPFYGVFDGASTGAFVTPKLVHMVDVGTGALLSVGANPGQNAIAICGKTSKAVTNWSAVGATKGVITGGSAVYGTGMDIVVAKIDASTGAVIWGKQFGGAGDQVCNAVTIDNNGDVIIGGNYNGTLVLGSTTLPAADSSTAILFAAKLNGTTGAPISAASWGTAGRSNVGSVTVDASNNIIIAGSIGASVDMGGGVSMTWAGLTDAFAAKLTTGLVPVWAKSFGDTAYDQTVKSVATSSSGDVYLGGNFEGTLGALGLTASANTALDAFDAQLSGVDGSPLCAKSYGDAAGTQGIATITVARTATGALANSIMIGGSFSSDIQIGSFDLNTGSPGLSASFIARLTP
jgi:hypothetical protein